MGNLNEQLNADLKKAMLAGDKELVSVLRGLKSSIQYAKVELGADGELSEQDIQKVLQKESKKRADATGLYIKADDKQRADKEKYEKEIIDAYLPELLSEEEVSKLVDEVISGQKEVTPQIIGKVIGEVRQKSGGLADGALIAQLVKERLNQ